MYLKLFFAIIFLSSQAFALQCRQNNGQESIAVVTADFSNEISVIYKNNGKKTQKIFESQYLWDGHKSGLYTAKGFSLFFQNDFGIITKANLLVKLPEKRFMSFDLQCQH